MIMMDKYYEQAVACVKVLPGEFFQGGNIRNYIEGK